MTSIEKLLQELKSTSFQSRGQAAEELVLRKLTQLDLRVLARNLKIDSVEVDFLVQSKNGKWIVLEVKTDPEFKIDQRISEKQTQRLLRVAHFLSSKNKIETEVWLVLVNKNGQLSYVPLI